MEHNEIQDKLSELRDGELSPADRGLVARHLEACASCRASVQEDALLARAFFARPPRPTPQQTELFVRRVMARLPAPSRAGASVLAFWETLVTARWLAPALGLACAALLLSFAPYGRARAERGAPLFVADGREVVLTPPDLVRPADLGEALDPAGEER